MISHTGHTAYDHAWPTSHKEDAAQPSYSTTFLAKSLPTHGQLDTLELSSLHAGIANQTFLECDLYPFPKVHVGSALQLLRDPKGAFVNPPGTDEGLSETERGYDLVFIDANKDQIDEYLLEAIRLSRKGGLIVVDNAVRGGRCVHYRAILLSVGLEGG